MMKARNLRDALNFYSGNIPVVVRVGRKEYELRSNVEMRYRTVTDDFTDPKEEQIIVLVAEDE